MDQEQLMKSIVEEVVKGMMANDSTPNAGASSAGNQGGRVTAENYPLAEKLPEKIFSQTGKRFDELELKALLDGKLMAEDMRISPETLEMQAQVAESVDRSAFAANLRRAAELINVPDARVLEIYNALRPYRSTKQELLDIADELEKKYDCKICSRFVREAANVYEQRGRLKT
jgi:propanediol dehydratase small subunit